MRETELSIIIPYYNSVESLEVLLSSIYKEPLRRTETIVVNDNSTSNLEAYEKLKETFSQVIFVDNETGVRSAGSCRNVGLGLAKGKWLMFADADDYFLPGWFSIVSRYFRTDQEIIYFRPTSIDLATGETTDRHQFYSKLINEHHFRRKGGFERIRYDYHVPWSKLYRRSFVESHGIRFDEVMYGNDVMFSVKCGFHAQKIRVSGKCIYCVTKGTQTLTQARSLESFLIRRRAHIRKIRFLHDHSIKISLKSRLIYWLDISFVYNAFQVWKMGYGPAGVRKLYDAYKTYILENRGR